MSSPDLLSPANRMKFGNYLFCQKDYLRAVNEYQSSLQTINNDTARFKMAYGLAEMGRLTEAADDFKGLFFSSPLFEEARFEFYKTNFLTGDYQNFRELVDNKTYHTVRYKNEVNKLNNVSYLLTNNLLPDSSDFFSPFNNSEKDTLLNFYKRKINPGYKSIPLAAALSAVLPGLGKIYTEEYGDGITAFIATGILTYLSIDNFNAGHKFRGYLFGGLAALFYAGNIYGSAASAQIFNAGIKFNFEKDVKFFLNEKKYFEPDYKFLCN
jgi:hypothetical protein